MAKKWRKVTRGLHRDLGYLTTGLTICYAVSGVAVNHVESWNPNRTMARTQVDVGPLSGDNPAARRADAITKLQLEPEDVRSELQQGPNQLSVFFVSGSELTIDPATGKGLLQLVEDRPVLRQFNALHLNDLKGAWTWFADAYAIILAFLAVSGLVMLKGRLGFAGRGKWLFALGLIVPIAFIVGGSY